MSRADSPLRDRMIFNVGARRSGTFWLQRIVTAHPDVDAVPAETHLFSHGIAPLFERFTHGLKGSPQVGQIWIDRDELLDSARDFCDRVLLAQFATGARYLAERTPVHVLHLGLIGELYPDARVVHIIRDGRDVVRSLLAKQWGPATIEEAAGEWVESVRRGREGGFPGVYIEVFYEHLLAEPEGEIRRLLAQLGLQAGDDAVAAAVAEARETVNVDWNMPGVEAGKWRKAFKPRDMRKIEAIAGDLLEELGYERAAGGRGVSRRDTPAPAPVPATDPAPVKAAAAGERVLTPGVVPTDAAGARMAIDVLDRLLAAMREGDGDGAAALLTPGATVRLAEGGQSREASGPGAAAELRAVVAADAVLRERLRRSEVFVQPSGVAAVVTFELRNGDEAERIFVIAAEADRIARLSLYRS